MSKSRIQVLNLQKKYRISDLKARPDTLYEAAKYAAMGPARRLVGLLKGDIGAASDMNREFWALNGLSFDILEGQVVGLVGGNGAGKSTLLKLLSRVTRPTSGSIKMYGHVGALLEVGTGFHGQLTGRENVYLNGSILGMRKKEIQRKFDQIIDFAGIGQYTDTPVRFYSSGMTLRLAFAVAAYLEPEILIMDEVLSVGDIGFQKKCLNRVREVANEGRTVIFVSHQMGQISGLCDRVILLENGRIKEDGIPQKVIPAYYKSVTNKSEVAIIDRVDRTGTGDVRIARVWLENAIGQETLNLISGEKVVVNIEVHRKKIADLRSVCIGLVIRNDMGMQITNLGTHAAGRQFSMNENSKILAQCTLERFPLNNGNFILDISLHSGAADFTVYDDIESVINFSVVPGDFYGTGLIPGRQYLMMHDNVWMFNATSVGKI